MPNEMSFDGTTDLSAQFAPGVSTGQAHTEDLPVFYDAATNEPIGFDPWNLKDQGRINSTVMGIFARKGRGKTATNMLLADTLSVRNMDGDRLKIALDDHRRNRNRGEYDKLCRLHATKPIPLRDYRLNLLDPQFGFAYEDQLQSLQSKLEFSINRNLTIREAEALACGLWMIRDKFPDSTEMALLAMQLRRLDQTDLQAAQGRYITDLAGRHGDNEAFKKLMSLAPRQTDDILSAASDMASTVEAFVQGRFGRMFGGTHSLAKAMQQPLFVLDYAGLADDLVMLAQSWHWEIKKTAIVNGDKRFYFDVEFHDENYKLWRYLQYAEAMSDFLKQIRQTATFVVMNSHRYADYRSVGETSSRQYHLATNVFSDVDMFLYGQQTRESAREIAERHGWGETYQAIMRQQEIGHWLLVIGEEEPVPVYTKLTDLEKILTASNAANDRLVIKSAK